MQPRRRFVVDSAAPFMKMPFYIHTLESHNGHFQSNEVKDFTLFSAPNVTTEGGFFSPNFSANQNSGFLKKKILKEII